MKKFTLIVLAVILTAALVAVDHHSQFAMLLGVTMPPEMKQKIGDNPDSFILLARQNEREFIAFIKENKAWYEMACKYNEKFFKSDQDRAKKLQQAFIVQEKFYRLFPSRSNADGEFVLRKTLIQNGSKLTQEEWKIIAGEFPRPSVFYQNWEDNSMKVLEFLKEFQK